MNESRATAPDARWVKGLLPLPVLAGKREFGARTAILFSNVVLQEETGKRSVIFMQPLDARRRKLTGLARGIRAAIVMPLLFALALLVIGQPEMAGFAVFGTFAHLAMVDYSSLKEARLAESGTLTVFGAVLVTLGTLASTNLWLAVAGAITAGSLSRFPTAWPASARIQVSALRPALLMTFMLAVAAPTPPHSLPPQLGGWFLAGLVAQVALRWLWLPIRSVGLATSSDSVSPTPLGDAASTGAAMGLAVLLAHLLSLDHAFWVVLGVAPVLAASQISPARTFWRQQAGTLLGLLAGALLVAGIGAHQPWYWIALPCTVFISAYLSSAVGFMAGQAGFTAFAVVLFCILTPLQRHVGIVRVEDIALGGVISLLVGSLQHLGSCLKRRALAEGAPVRSALGAGQQRPKTRRSRLARISPWRTPTTHTSSQIGSLE